MVATIYGPITFSPIPLLVFKSSDLTIISEENIKHSNYLPLLATGNYYYFLLL